MKKTITTPGRKRLLEKIKALKGFQVHLLVFAIVNGGLWLAWLVTARMSIYAWPVYFTAVWIILLFFHYMAAERVFNERNKTD